MRLRLLTMVTAAALAAGCAGQIDVASPGTAAAAADAGGAPGASASDAGSGPDAGAAPADAGGDATADAGGSSADAGDAPADAGQAGADAGDGDAGSSGGDAGTAADGGDVSTADAGSAGGSDAGSDGGAGDGSDGGVLAGGDPDAGVFTPVAASAAVSKVKNLLVGLGPTNDEVAAVASDPRALKGLIDQWVALPQYEPKMRAFFATAFQQTQVTSADFADQGADADDARVLQALRESFARTALQLIAEGRPFTEAMTTRRFMLTPRLMSLYAFIDTQLIDDNGRMTDQFLQANPAFQYSVTAAVVPPADSLDPASPNFMVFTNPNLSKVYDALCPQDPIVYKPATGPMVYLGGLRGQAQSFTVTLADGTKHQCNPPSGPQIYSAADFNQWQMVTIRPPAAGEAPTRFWDLASLRSATELVLNVPRVSFFSTPAFFAGWQTNLSNVARVTLNQTMIVALGKAIDPSNTTSPPSLAALDQAHAAPGTACFACHQSLDPMRQFFRQAYSIHFHQQTIAAQQSLPGQVAYWGESSSGTSIFDLGAALAGHPRFALNWVQKLCTYATSAACAEDDPELLRLVSVFQGSNYSWPVLVRELFSSPLVTYLADTATAEQAGQTFPLARRDHLCAALSARLGIGDVCGLDVNTTPPANLRVIRTIATALPSDQYSRGAEGAILANDPSLVFRRGMENVCVALANQLVDNGTTSRYQSSKPDLAIPDFVHTLMGITGDRDGQRIALLTSHFTAAKATSGVTATDALKSTFVLACLSPSVVGVGQ